MTYADATPTAFNTYSKLILKSCGSGPGSDSDIFVSKAPVIINNGNRFAKRTKQSTGNGSDPEPGTGFADQLEALDEHDGMEEDQNN